MKWNRGGWEVDEKKSAVKSNTWLWDFSKVLSKKRFFLKKMWCYFFHTKRVVLFLFINLHFPSTSMFVYCFWKDWWLKSFCELWKTSVEFFFLKVKSLQPPLSSFLNFLNPGIVYYSQRTHCSHKTHETKILKKWLTFGFSRVFFPKNERSEIEFRYKYNSIHTLHLKPNDKQQQQHRRNTCLSNGENDDDTDDVVVAFLELDGRVRSVVQIFRTVYTEKCREYQYENVWKC